MKRTYAQELKRRQEMALVREAVNKAIPLGTHKDIVILALLEIVQSHMRDLSDYLDES